MRGKRESETAKTIAYEIAELCGHGDIFNWHLRNTTEGGRPVMKYSGRIMFALLIAFIAASFFPSYAQAAAQSNSALTGESPVIAVRQVPKYNVESEIKGYVFMKDDSDFIPEDYRISLYLQVTKDGKYWVKPTYAHPYADLDEMGRFSVEYATGGRDLEAVALHVMLIPAWFTPDSDFDRTRLMALDYVKITRDPSGDVSIYPQRESPTFGYEYVLQDD